MATLSDLTLPRWVKFWLQLTSFVCIFDGAFIILRPHTFPDGSLGFIFWACELGLLSNFLHVGDSFLDETGIFFFEFLLIRTAHLQYHLLQQFMAAYWLLEFGVDISRIYFVIKKHEKKNLFYLQLPRNTLLNCTNFYFR